MCRALKDAPQPLTLADRSPEDVRMGTLEERTAKPCRKAHIAACAKPLHVIGMGCVDDWTRPGYSPDVVQQWAGHADIRTTMAF